MPLPYETSAGLPQRGVAEPPAGSAGPAELGRITDAPRRDTGIGSPPAPAAAGSAERSRIADSPGRPHAGAGSTAVLPAPGLRPAPKPDSVGEVRRAGVDDGASGRSAVRALPDPDAHPRSRPGRSGEPGEPGRSGGSGVGRRRQRGDDPANTAERDAALPPLPVAEPDESDRRSARALRSVDSDPDASENTGIHYGFEDEPSLLLQWGAFILQTLVGAACGLGAWLGFYQLWERWPFYTAPAAGAAMAIMLAVTRSIRRRYGHELDLLTAVLTVGVGVVLTVLPAAFVLQHV